jgi:hypothetical protein
MNYKINQPSIFMATHIKVNIIIWQFVFPPCPLSLLAIETLPNHFILNFLIFGRISPGKIKGCLQQVE